MIQSRGAQSYLMNFFKNPEPGPAPSDAPASNAAPGCRRYFILSSKVDDYKYNFLYNIDT